MYPQLKFVVYVALWIMVRCERTRSACTSSVRSFYWKTGVMAMPRTTASRYRESREWYRYHSALRSRDPRLPLMLDALMPLRSDALSIAAVSCWRARSGSSRRTHEYLLLFIYVKSKTNTLSRWHQDKYVCYWLIAERR